MKIVSIAVAVLVMAPSIPPFAGAGGGIRPVAAAVKP